MPSYSQKSSTAWRAALNEVMTKIPVDQATQEVKAYMAEIILKAAAEGQTNYEVLLAAASQQYSGSAVAVDARRIRLVQ